MKRLLIGALAVLLAQAAFAEKNGTEDPDPALGDLMRVLRDEGVLDQQQYEDLTKKAAEEANKAAEQAAPESDGEDEYAHWYDRIDLWGDFRGRAEGFHYYDDPVNGQRGRSDRFRLRYRLRLNAKGHVNDYADVFVQVAGGNDSRTTNDTLGDPIDFGKNDIFIQMAYARVSPFPKGQLPDREGSLWGFFGRTPQPWRWGVYKDWIWDDEISPAGLYLQGDTKLAEFECLKNVKLFGNGGYYIIDEESTSKDPSLSAVQVGFHADPESPFELGSKLSLFTFFNLNSGFISRGVDSSGQSAATSSAGNILGGLTGDPTGGHLNVIEFGTYVTARLIEQWPITLYGNISHNFDAESATVVNPIGSAIPGTFRASPESLFWVVGFDVGDKKEWVKFRMLYAWLEANAFPSQFIDSDLHDGVSNRRGFVWGLTKSVMTNVDVSATAFLDHSIKETGAYLNSLSGSHRFRMQANVVLSF